MMNQGQQHVIEDDQQGGESSYCHHSLPPTHRWSSSIACCWTWLISLVFGPRLLFRGPFCIMAGREPVFWHALRITSGILSTWRWEEAGITNSERFLIGLVIYFYYKECWIHLCVSCHNPRTFQTLPQYELTPSSFTETRHSCIQDNHYRGKTSRSIILRISSGSVRTDGGFADKLS